MTDTRVVVTTVVSVDVGTAFDVFTRDIDVWWKRGPRFRPESGAHGTVSLEAGVGGRLVEQSERGETRVMGTVTDWRQPHLVALDFTLPGFEHDAPSRLKVRFEPSGSDTRVTVEQLTPAGPWVAELMEMGFDQSALINLIGNWWGELLGELRVRAATR